MKKYALFLIISILLCSCFTARAQYNNEAITYKSFGNYLNSSGDKLSKADMQGLLSDELYTDYLKGRRKLTTGLVFTGVGVVAGVSGVALGSSILNDAGASSSVTGAVVGSTAGILVIASGAIAGAVLLAVGIPFTVAGHSGLKGVAASHNSAPSASPVSLALGPTPHGLGLSLSF